MTDLLAMPTANLLNQYADEQEAAGETDLATIMREGAQVIAALSAPAGCVVDEAARKALLAIAASRIEATGTPPIPDLTAEQAWRIANAALAAAPAVSGAGDVFNFAAHLQRQRDWSLQTFGPGPRTTGVTDHIRKELAEVEAAPEDGEEWIDVVILALDGAWRAGLTPQQIIAGIVAKQTKNEGRNWPDWRTADPSKAIEHDRKGEG